jgi:predicted acetyltransferase
MLKLVSPHLDFIQSYLAMMEEMRAANEKIWKPNLPQQETAAQFVERLVRSETEPLPGMVPESSYWGVIDGEVVGRIALRHTLEQGLAEFGGNIGYEVRPSARRKGVATEMLRAILQTPKVRELGRMLLTCSPDNMGSIRTIEKNGGILEKTAFVERVNRETCYYWIQI